MINYSKLGLKYQRGKVLELRNVGVKAARRNTPVDTGNLQQNAVYSIATKDGFKIVWDEKNAYYLPYVNEGINVLHTNSAKVLMNKDFVLRGMEDAIKVIKSTFQNYDRDESKLHKNKVADTLPLYLNKNKDISGYNITRMEYLLKKSKDNYKQGKALENANPNDEVIYREITGGTEIYSLTENGGE